MDQNQSKIRRPSPSVTPRAKKLLCIENYQWQYQSKTTPVGLPYMQLEFSLCEDGNTGTPLSVSLLENMSGRGLTSAGNKEKEIRKLEY